MLASVAATACSRREPAPAPPPKWSDAEVEVALHRAPGVPADAPCTWSGLGRKPGAIVALCAPTEGTSTSIVGPHVVLAEARGMHLNAVASTQLVLAETHCELHSGEQRPSHEPPRFELDAIGYRVGQGNIAIGVRFTCHAQAPGGGGGSETRLYLLERAAASLRQIFDQPISSTSVDRENRRTTVAQGTLSEGTALHDGHYDLALHTTTSATDLDHEPAEAPAPATAEKTLQLFVFSGDRYVPAPAPAQ